MFKLAFTSFVKDIEKEMEKAEKKQLAKASKYLTKKLKEVSSQRFGADSSITQGVDHRNSKHYSLVGIGPKGYAAHLIEFGTDSRFTKSGKGTGYIKANPFVFPTFDAESDAVTDILQEVWF